MNKTAIKNFSIDARNKLIEDIKLNLNNLGITEEGIIKPSSVNSEILIFEENNFKLIDKDIHKYNKLIEELNKRENETDFKSAYKSIVEEVAYTWFNRIIALRFMEVNNYLPDKMRVLSSISKVKEPDFITNYRDTDIGISDEEFEYLDNLKLKGDLKSMEEMFKFMFIKQCNSLNKQLPHLFERTNDYTELLLNISYIDDNGVIQRLINEIDEDDFNIEKTGQIEIIGWMYQYYNSEVKSEVDKSKSKVNKDTLPAKTQLFTPEWIVKYIVENSLGRLLIEREIAKGNNKSEEEIAKDYNWNYYLKTAEQIDSVKIELIKIIQSRKDLNLEDITFIDPSMGSGHILVYAFEVLLQSYLKEGYRERDAAELIIENNLYGLDIDKRAYQLAYFAIMMKGREYSRRILDKNINNNLNYFKNSKNINLDQINYMGYGLENKENLKNNIIEIVNLFENAEELGSIIKLDKNYNYEHLIEFINSTDESLLPTELLGINILQDNLIYIVDLCKTLSNTYNIVATNPPYLGRKHMSTNLTKYLDKNYPMTKSDLFAVFMEKSYDLLQNKGYYGMITQNNWMSTFSYKDYRKFKFNNLNIINLLNLGSNTFDEISGEVVQSVSFIIQKTCFLNLRSLIIDLTAGKDSLNKHNYFLYRNNNMYFIDNQSILQNNNYIFLYKDNNKLLQSETLGDIYKNIFRGPSISNVKNNIKNWVEIDIKNLNEQWCICDKLSDKIKWYIPYSKVISKNEIINASNYKYQNQQCLIWPDIKYNSKSINSRIKPSNIFIESGVNGIKFDNENDLYFFYVLFNIGLYEHILNMILEGGIHYSPIYIKSLPNIEIDKTDQEIIKNEAKKIELLHKNIFEFYDEFYLNFKKTLLLDENLLQDSVVKYKDAIYITLKNISNIENDLYYKIKSITNYNFPKNYKDLQSKYSIEQKDNVDIIKDFISYGVGCIMGRYSLDKEGLAFAGGEFNLDNYSKFKPVKDNIVLLTEDEYAEDDLGNKLFEFIEISLGKEYLEDNIKFISSIFKGKDSPREKIRKYLFNDFFKDHVKKYQKTPIYWMYDSGAGKTKKSKKNGFKALIYLHRYNQDTTGLVRVDYLHNIQNIYSNMINSLENEIIYIDDTNEKKKIDENIKNLKQKYDECVKYDEKLGHMATERIQIDLDDGVKVNYEKIQTDKNGKKYKILEEI